MCPFQPLWLCLDSSALRNGLFHPLHQFQSLRDPAWLLSLPWSWFPMRLACAQHPDVDLVSALHNPWVNRLCYPLLELCVLSSQPNHKPWRIVVILSFRLSYNLCDAGGCARRVCLVAQSCPTLCDPTDCSLPGSSAHGDSPGKNTGVGCHALLLGIEPRSPTLQVNSLPSEAPGKLEDERLWKNSLLPGLL